MDKYLIKKNLSFLNFAEWNEEYPSILAIQKVLQENYL